MAGKAVLHFLCYYFLLENEFVGEIDTAAYLFLEKAYQFYLMIAKIPEQA